MSRIKISLVRDEHECYTTKPPLQVYTKLGETIALYACDRCGDFFTTKYDGEFTLADFQKRDAVQAKPDPEGSGE